MFRRVVAITMVLMMAAGPSLCCCSFTHLFARHADDRSARAEVPSCCQTSSKGKQQRKHDRCPHGKGDHKKPGCPCRDDISKPALVDRAIELPDQLRAASFLAIRSFASDDLSSLIGVSASPGGPMPFLTVHDILHVHHQLRC